MFPVGFEPKISAGERPQTDALDHEATGIGQDPILLVGKQGVSNISLSVQFVNITVQIIAC